MSLETAEVAVMLVEGYLICGLAFAAVFLTRGVSRLDPAMAGAPFSVRLLILPGMTVFWPLFAWRWSTGHRPPVERNAHRLRAALRRDMEDRR